MWVRRLTRAPFHTRYAQARVGGVLLFVLAVGIALWLDPGMAGWLGVVIAAVLGGWVLTLRGILCPACHRPAEDLGEDGIPILGAAPTRCASCHASLAPEPGPTHD